MGFRFWRRISLVPGVTLNLSRSGASVSLGPRGAKLTFGPRGTRATVGIPGTGLFYTIAASGHRSGRSLAASHAAPSVAHRPEERLELSFFDRLLTPKKEEAFVDGCREFLRGNYELALRHLEQGLRVADVAFLAGCLALRLGQPDKAAQYFEMALARHRELGRYFAKYGIAATCSLAITDEVVAYVQPNLRGVLLGLVEAYQLQKRWDAAIACLNHLRRLEPEDIVVRLSLAELLMSAHPEDRQICRRVLALAEGVENETPLHTALGLYKARALRILGMPEAALEVLSAALRKARGCSVELLCALRYERARVYESLGRPQSARRDLEKIYADAPDYDDVAARLRCSGSAQQGSEDRRPSGAA